MINEENLSKLYDGILENTELTTKQMNSYGFNSKDLNVLIQEDSIERVKRGLYSLKSVDGLFYYGKKLIAKKEHKKATMCFEKCLELDPTHLGTCFQLFLRSIQKRDYQRTFELFDSLLQSENEFYNVDANYYLYLLSIITEVPEKHREYARYLKFEDIKVSYLDKRYNDTLLQNKIRTAVLQRKFPYAIKQFRELTVKHGNLTVQDIITRTLLLQAINSETKSKNIIVNLIKEKKYDQVIEHLLNKQNRHNLSVYEEYILKLARMFIETKESLVIPKRKIGYVKNVFEAIDINNFDTALSLSLEYNEKNNITNDASAIYLILNDICDLIATLSKSAQTHVETQESLIQISKTVVKTIGSPVDNFSSIVSSLIKKDLVNATGSLRKYMEAIGKTEFEFLIIDLIKISLLEKDDAFTKPMLVLTLISRENYSFDISNYIQEFYISLSQNKFEESRIYLDIISKANTLGQNYIATDVLYQVLEASEKALNYKRDNSIFTSSEKELENSNQVIADLVVQSLPTEPKKVDSSVDDKYCVPNKKLEHSIVQNIEVQDELNEIKFIAKKHEELIEKKGIILLRSMDDVRNQRILDIVYQYPDMAAFIICEDNKQQVVLRYKTVIDEDIDVKKIIKLANAAYGKGNYDECIKYNLQLLQGLSKPSVAVYSKLGLSYMKKKNIPQAIDYLRVANALAKEENVDLDFTDLILSLNGNIPKTDKKPRFKMVKEDFDYSDVNNYYGIENFDEVNRNIIESGLDVENACRQLGLTLEQINIIKLIYAREFYIQGNFDKGDLFLKSVERSKSKTKNTISLLEEIRKNKRFYQNRQVRTPKRLSLTLHP